MNTFYCDKCRKRRPDEGPNCGFCGTHRKTCETAEPDKPTLRCIKCGGNSFNVDLQRRAECAGCGFAVASLGGAVIAERPKSVALPPGSMTKREKPRRDRHGAYGCRGRCDGKGRRV